MTGDTFLLICLIGGAVVAGLFYLNRWASKRMNTQEEMIEKTRQSVSIYVIDKKKAKAAESNLPKSVIENLPRLYKLRKVPLVKAKVGPQIMTLLCEKRVYDAIPLKKNVKVEIAGIYIIDMKGMKTKKEMKEINREKSGKKPWYKFFSKG